MYTSHIYIYIERERERERLPASPRRRRCRRSGRPPAWPRRAGPPRPSRAPAPPGRPCPPRRSPPSGPRAPARGTLAALGCCFSEPRARPRVAKAVAWQASSYIADKSETSETITCRSMFLLVDPNQITRCDFVPSQTHPRQEKDRCKVHLACSRLLVLAAAHCSLCSSEARQ